MKPLKKLISALLAAGLMFSLAACDSGGEEGGGKADIPANQTGSGDFQKNLHQSNKLSFLETDTGYYFTWSSLYYIAKDTMTATPVCAKPECDHRDENVCNAIIHADYILTGGERIYYVGYDNDPKTIGSVKLDATDRETVQELKFNETSSSQSSYDRAIYHRGYVYYVSDDILYRVKLGGEKDSAEVIWNPEDAGTTQSYGGMVQFNPNAIRYTLWADGDILYFMANVQTTDGTYKDVLFQCGLDGSDVKQVWVTPDADQVGEWERTGVSVSQWYVTNGYIYFYLSGGDMWRTELATGKLEKMADTHEKTQYGSAVFSDDYMCLLNDEPTDFYGEFELGGIFRGNADTIFLYGLDGTLLKELSLDSLFDGLGDRVETDMLMCDSTDVYFFVTVTTFTTQTSGRITSQTLWRANFDTGEVTQVYRLR